MESNKRDNRKLFFIFLSVPLLMFCFAFALVPLYGLYCEVAGINRLQGSKQDQEFEAGTLVSADENRVINIQFDATVHTDMPGEFRPLTRSVELNPGEIFQMNYFVRNNSKKTVVSQAVPSITPWWGTEYFKKIECFCFEQQTLAPGEEKEMALQFYVHPDLPDDISTLTLSYTLMNTQSDGNVVELKSAL